MPLSPPGGGPNAPLLGGPPPAPRRRCWPPSKAVIVAGVILLVGFAVTAGAGYAVHRSSLASAVATQAEANVRVGTAFRSAVSEALIGLSVAATALGGLGYLNNAAFYAVARHMASQGYASGHISLLEYVTDDRREAAENATAALWGFPTPITQRNASGALVVAPRRPFYAIYSNIFDLEDPSLRDFAAFDFLSIPLRAAAWNISLAKNRIVLTQPTRRLVGGPKVLLVLTPIFTSLLPWRDRSAFIQYWRTPDATMELLGHLVTVFAFDSKTSDALTSTRTAGVVGLADLTDTAYGAAVLAAEDARTAALPSVGGYEYDPTNATMVAAASARRDISPLRSVPPADVLSLPNASFLYAYSSGWGSGAGGEAAVTLDEAGFRGLYHDAQASGRSAVQAYVTVVGARVMALYSATSPAAVPVLSGLAAAAIGGSLATMALLAVVGYAIVASLEKQAAERERRAREGERLLAIAHRTHDFTVSYLADQARNPMHGLMGTLESMAGDIPPGPDGGPLRDDVAVMRSCANRLHRLLNDVSDFSLLVAGRMHVHVRPVKVRDLVLTAVTNLRGESSLPLRYAVASDVPLTMDTDAMRFLQVLTIALSNANRYNKPDARDAVVHLTVMLAPEAAAAAPEAASLRRGSSTSTTGSTAAAAAAATYAEGGGEGAGAKDAAAAAQPPSEPSSSSSPDLVFRVCNLSVAGIFGTEQGRIAAAVFQPAAVYHALVDVGGEPAAAAAGGKGGGGPSSAGRPASAPAAAQTAPGEGSAAKSGGGTTASGTRSARSASTAGLMHAPTLTTRAVAASTLLLGSDTVGVVQQGDGRPRSSSGAAAAGSGGGGRLRSNSNSGGPVAAGGGGGRSSSIHGKATRGGFGLPLARMISANIGAEVCVYDVHGHSLEEVAAARPGDPLLADASPNAGGPFVTVFEVRAPQQRPAVEPTTTATPTPGGGGGGRLTRSNSGNSVGSTDTNGSVGSVNMGGAGLAAAGAAAAWRESEASQPVRLLNVRAQMPSSASAAEGTTAPAAGGGASTPSPLEMVETGAGSRSGRGLAGGSGGGGGGISGGSATPGGSWSPSAVAPGTRQQQPASLHVAAPREDVPAARSSDDDPAANVAGDDGIAVAQDALADESGVLTPGRLLTGVVLPLPRINAGGAAGAASASNTPKVTPTVPSTSPAPAPLTAPAPISAPRLPPPPTSSRQSSVTPQPTAAASPVAPDVVVAVTGVSAPASPASGAGGSATGSSARTVPVNPVIRLPGLGSASFNSSSSSNGGDGGGSSSSWSSSSVAGLSTISVGRAAMLATPPGVSPSGGGSSGCATPLHLPSSASSVASGASGTAASSSMSAGSVTSPSQATAAGAAAAATHHRSLGLRVLYADDETVNRKLMGKMLAKLGCEVTAVEDGDEVEPALAAVERGTDAGSGRGATMAGRRYDVVLLDIVMKRVSGDAVCRRLVHGGDGGRPVLPPSVPVIAVTGNARDYDELRRAGFAEVIEKPFTVEKLQAALGRHVPALQRGGSSGGGGAAAGGNRGGGE